MLRISITVLFLFISVVSAERNHKKTILENFPELVGKDSKYFPKITSDLGFTQDINSKGVEYVNKYRKDLLDLLKYSKALIEGKEKINNEYLDSFGYDNYQLYFYSQLLKFWSTGDEAILIKVIKKAPIFFLILKNLDIQLDDLFVAFTMQNDVPPYMHNHPQYISSVLPMFDKGSLNVELLPLYLKNVYDFKRGYSVEENIKFLENLNTLKDETVLNVFFKFLLENNRIEEITYILNNDLDKKFKIVFKEYYKVKIKNLELIRDVIDNQ